MIKKLINKIRTLSRAKITLLGAHGKRHLLAELLYIHYKFKGVQ